MQSLVKTLIIGHSPLADYTGKTKRELCYDKYFRELLSDYDLGEVHYASVDNFKEIIDSLNPFVVIVFDDYYAHEIKSHKKDVFLFPTDHIGSVFHRKAEIDSKQKKQREVFRQAASVVEKIRADGSEQEPALRRFAAMGYKEIYDIIIRMIISDREDWRKQAWSLLTSNSSGSDFIWMRVQLICEVWQHCDGKGKEEFLCLAMNQYIDNGLAHKMMDFTDEDGQVFHQYMFHYLDGSDANYIRRIPVGFKGQDKYAYQALLDKYETPNGPALMMEAGQFRSKREKYLKGEDTA